MSPAQDAILEELRETIVRELHPRMIVLFGSQAKGDATADSDWDVLIVGDPGAARNRRQQLGRLYLALGQLPVPTDLLLYTPDEVEAWRDSKSHIIGQAFREGRVLYERSA